MAKSRLGITQVDSTSSELTTNEETIRGNMKVDGNLEVVQQLKTKELKVLGENNQVSLMATANGISFRQACKFEENVEFYGGATIGLETTYNSGYVGAQTLMAGDRLIVGTTHFKITDDDRSILAQTYLLDIDKVIANTLKVAVINSTNLTTTSLDATKITGKEIYSDTIKTNKLMLDEIAGLTIRANDLQANDLLVNGYGVIQKGLTINSPDTNGAALTVNGGEIVANWGITSNTRNNRFQTLEITGSGKEHDVCFTVDRYVDTLFEGDVTIENSRLVLDNSKMYADDIVVTPLSGLADSDNVSGIQLTSKTNWNTYANQMMTEVSSDKQYDVDDYDPVATVQDAVQRNATNYASIQAQVKNINPITYKMEQDNQLVPKKFTIKNGVHRIDANGNALLKNVISEKGRFSTLDAYQLKVNQFNIDKVLATSVASNVVDTDNLLKSRGIAEFDGVINTSADIFVEEDSKINVANGASITLQNGASLEIADGATFKMGTNTSVKMSGDIELDLAKLVFVDSNTNRKYRISFRDADSTCEGTGVVMEYSEVSDEEETSTQSIVEQTSRNVNDLDAKLKALGL